MPDLYIITGSNGAGKSTVGSTFLPDHIADNYTIFDGDKLFMLKQKELWNSGITANKEARKIALAFVVATFEKLAEAALATKDNFVYEGHFTNDETWKMPLKFKESGYNINLIFLGLNDTDLSATRVLDRTNSGGHYVPRNTIEDNFYGNLEKLNKYYTFITDLSIIDTSQAKHTLLANFMDGNLKFSIPYYELPDWFVQYLPLLSGKIKAADK